MAGRSLRVTSETYESTAGWVCMPARMPAVSPKDSFITLWPTTSTITEMSSVTRAPAPMMVSEVGSDRAARKPAPAVVPIAARNRVMPSWRSARLAP